MGDYETWEAEIRTQFIWKKHGSQSGIEPESPWSEVLYQPDTHQFAFKSLVLYSFMPFVDFDI